MEDSYQKLFKTLHPTAPKEALLASIIGRIHREQIRLARKRFVAFVFASLASLSGVVAVAVLLIRSFVSSGSYHYLSLIFSDGASLLSYWKEIALFMAESLPAVGLAFLFGAGLLFVWSLVRTVKQAEVAFRVA
jgi:hypothetical protein